jgi:RNase H-like domain found in reverse transcriptase
VVNTLINIVTSNPVLHRPDHEKQFELKVDASQFAIRAILYQQDDQGRQQLVAYHSETLNKVERSYDIYDHELLAIVCSLENWRHLLLGAKHEVLIFTDHANLQYYRQAHKISRHVARYIPCLAEYDYKLIHKPGAQNKADHLLRRPDFYQGQDDNTDVTILPDSVFICAITLSTLEDRILGA